MLLVRQVVLGLGNDHTRDIILAEGR